MPRQNRHHFPVVLLAAISLAAVAHAATLELVVCPLDSTNAGDLGSVWQPLILPIVIE